MGQCAYVATVHWTSIEREYARWLRTIRVQRLPTEITREWEGRFHEPIVEYSCYWAWAIKYF
jgi:hypothetical protein